MVSTRASTRALAALDVSASGSIDGVHIPSPLGLRPRHRRMEQDVKAHPLPPSRMKDEQEMHMTGMIVLNAANTPPRSNDRPAAIKRERSTPSTVASSSKKMKLEDADEAYNWKGLPVRTEEDDSSKLTPNTPVRGNASKTSRTPKSTGKNKYGLTPGKTPFPDWPHPSREECQLVSDRLSAMHGYRPKPDPVISAPSTTVAGCGEVPAVLDALLRTLLSAATSLANSSRAFQGIVDKYGLLEDGIGKGSPDWNKVRLGTEQELFETIKCGGLATNKSKNIKAILDLVFEENLSRRKALLEAETSGDMAKGPQGIENESKQSREAEIAKTDQKVLSLDHLHDLKTEDAMTTLVSYPGIGVKTAACTMLFCMQRPSFAVDTHVWRLSKWLGWVPPHATRDQTYMHCDLRIPDELKYELHALFWKHGKYCSKCQMTGVKGRDEFKNIPCAIEDLIQKNGGRQKTGQTPMKPKKSKTLHSGKKGKRKAMSDLEDSDEDKSSDSHSEYGS